MSDEPYARFASVYDTPDHGLHSTTFLRKAWPLLRRSPKTIPVLDLGCGTGTLTVALAKKGRRTIGIDRSSKMLAIARRRCRPYSALVTLRRADLTSFRIGEKASAAIACADVVNHFPSVREIAALFRQTYLSLHDGGVFVFDTIRRTCFERFWADRTYYMEGPGGDLVMECDWDPGRSVGTARMIAYEKRKTGSFRKSETVLTEYLHSDRDIGKALGAAGFTSIRREPWDPWPSAAEEASVLDRNYWIALKR